MAVGVWTLTEKSGYLGVLASSTFAASAYILISAGTLVMVTGFLGCGAILREQRGCLSMVSTPWVGRRREGAATAPTWAPIPRQVAPDLG